MSNFKINEVIWKLKDIILSSNLKLLNLKFIYMNILINKEGTQLMLLINWRTTTSCFSKPQRSWGTSFLDLRVYFLLFIIFLKRKTKEKNVDQHIYIYILSLAFGCSIEKCKNSILEQEKAF